MSTIDDLADGTTGHFWSKPGVDLDWDDALSGYVRRRDDNLFHVESLTTQLQHNRMMSGNDELEVPESVIAMTNKAGALFFDSAGVAQSNIFGALKASTETYRARGVVTGMSLDQVKSDKFRSVALNYFGVSFWSGFDALSESVKRGKDNRPTSYQASTNKVPSLEIQLSGWMLLKLGSTWSVEGPSDERRMSAPLKVTTESARARHWSDHLAPQMAIQNLLNIAHEGFMAARSGTAHIDFKDGYDPASAPEFWNNRFMSIPNGIELPNRRYSYPVFVLGDLGGVEGVRRWILLEKKYPRATGPLVNLYRYGRSGVEVALLELATAIEYWTKIHKTMGRQWAQSTGSRKKPNPLSHAMARKAGPAFHAFVGDWERWSRLFWDTNNSLKHSPNYQYDANEVRLLAESAAVLLECALLSRCSGSNAISKTICDGHRNHNLGVEVSRLVANSAP